MEKPTTYEELGVKQEERRLKFIDYKVKVVELDSKKLDLEK